MIATYRVNACLCFRHAGGLEFDAAGLLEPSVLQATGSVSEKLAGNLEYTGRSRLAQDYRFAVQWDLISGGGGGLFTVGCTPAEASNRSVKLSHIDLLGGRDRWRVMAYLVRFAWCGHRRWARPIR